MGFLGWLLWHPLLSEAIKELQKFNGVFGLPLDPGTGAALLHKAWTSIYAAWMIKALLSGQQKADVRKVVGRVVTEASQHGLVQADFPIGLWQQAQSGMKFRPSNR